MSMRRTGSVCRVLVVRAAVSGICWSCDPVLLPTVIVPIQLSSTVAIGLISLSPFLKISYLHSSHVCLLYYLPLSLVYIVMCAVGIIFVLCLFCFGLSFSHPCPGSRVRDWLESLVSFRSAALTEVSRRAPCASLLPLLHGRFSVRPSRPPPIQSWACALFPLFQVCFLLFSVNLRTLFTIDIYENLTNQDAFASVQI